MRLPFHLALNRLLVDAFTTDAATPVQLEVRLRKAMHRPCGRQESEQLQEWLRRRHIEKLVHFTMLENVVPMTRFGVIPREYLEMKVVQLALGAQFTDDQRIEGMPQYSCLSITSPNYRMFYSKRRQLGRRWAVLELDPVLLCRLYAAFAPTNAASGCVSSPGADGAERLFALPALREWLDLSADEPTDPQAEVLCDSIIRPENIVAIYVERQADADWLARKGICARVNEQMFRQRKDYEFWKAKNITQLPEFRRLSVAQCGGG